MVTLRWREGQARSEPTITLMINFFSLWKSVMTCLEIICICRILPCFVNATAYFLSENWYVDMWNWPLNPPATEICQIQIYAWYRDIFLCWIDFQPHPVHHRRMCQKVTWDISVSLSRSLLDRPMRQSSWVWRTGAWSKVPSTLALTRELYNLLNVPSWRTQHDRRPCRRFLDAEQQ